MENVFKITAFFLFLWQNAIRFYYLRQYSQTHQTVEKTQNAFFETLLGVWLGVFYVVPLGLWWCTAWLDFARFDLPAWVRVCGVLISSGSLVLFYLSHRDLGKNWSPLLEIRAGHSLIRQGVFRYIRHPMYASLLLGVLGSPFLTDNGAVSLLVSLGVGVFVGVRLPREEAFMEATWGESYKQYQAQTKKIIPCVW